MGNFFSDLAKSFDTTLKIKDNTYLKSALSKQSKVDICDKNTDVDSIFDFSNKETQNTINIKNMQNGNIQLKTGDLSISESLFGFSIQSQYDNGNLYELAIDENKDGNFEFYYKKTQDGEEILIDENSNGNWELRFIYDKNGALSEKIESTSDDGYITGIYTYDSEGDSHYSFSSTLKYNAARALSDVALNELDKYTKNN